MIHRSFVVVFVLAVLAAGTALAAAQPPVLDEIHRPVLMAQAPQTDSDSGQPNETAFSDEEQGRKPPLVIGLGVGSYTPLNSDVEDVFGGTKVRFGLRPILTELPKHMRLMYDVSYYSLEKNDDSAVLVPLTVGILQGFGQSTKTQTYAAVNVGAFYGDVFSPTMMVSRSGWGLTGNITIGLVYDKKLALEARYELMEKFAGFSFDSFSLMAAYKLFQVRF